MSDQEKGISLAVKPATRLLRPFFGRKIPPIPEKRNPYPEHTASVYSKLTFSWIYPLLKTGYLRTVQAEDLWDLKGTPLSVDQLYAKFETNLEKVKNKARAKAKSGNPNISDEELNLVPLPKFGLLLALHNTFAFKWWLAAFCKVLSDIAMATNPLLTRRLIEYVALREIEPEGKGIGYAIGTTVLSTFSAFLINYYFYYATMIGGEVRAVLSQAIYNKALRLSGSARTKYTNGKLTNLLSTDCHRIDFALQWTHFAWTFPISIAICIVVVVTNIGGVGMIGFAFLFICFILVAYCGKKMAKIRKDVNLLTDKRVSLMRELLHAMKIIKFYSWEDAYEKQVLDIRQPEMKKVRRMLTLRNILNALFTAAPTIAGLLAFVALERLGHALNPATVFSSLTTFNITRMPLMFLPLALMTSYEAVLALTRIQDLFSAPEHEEYVEHDPNQKDAIVIENGSFIWEKGMAEIEEEAEKSGDKSKQNRTEESDTSGTDSDKVEKTLTNGEDTEESSNSDKDHRIFTGFKNLNANIKPGEFIIIIGPIGSGKSSLLNAISGELKRTSGRVILNDEFAFCGQQWVQNATVENNILLGKPMRREFYERVIHDCCLERDLEILPAGDQTEVGERGITVSGGQKARINLARAAYWDAPIVLLDDVLSAVDAHVGKHIIENCITGLMKDKTRLLATHQLSMLSYADRIIFLNHRGDFTMGTMDELNESNEEFRHFLTFNQNDDKKQEEEDKEETEEEELDEEKMEIAKKQSRAEQSKGKLMQEEDRATNGVSIEVYKALFKFGGGYLGLIIFPILVLCVILSTFTSIFTSTWLSFWTSKKFKGRDDNFYIGIFVMFGVLSALTSFCWFYFLTFIGNGSSLRMHRMAVTRILHAPMSFFDTSPLGRVINRFSKDTDTFDNELTDQFRLLIMSLSIVAGVFILNIIYLPWFAIAVAGLMVVYLGFSAFYRASAREIKRLDSLGRSVMFSHFSETLNGLTTIKGYGDQERFIQTMKNNIDNMNAAYFLTLVNQRWLNLRLDYIGAALTLVVTMLCVTNQFHINPSSVGLVVSFLLQIVGLLSMVVRQTSSVENDMNSVERVHAYAVDLPQEAAFDIPETAPPSSWPESGSVHFKDVVLKYRDDTPPVLHNVTFSVNSREKIGICGRTGAGKSTIMVALYRLAELSSGCIDIDDVDISKLGLNQLRSKLSIIPQEPVLFHGTIRSNIDPFGTTPDAQLYDALKRSWLIDDESLSLIQRGETDQIKFALDCRVEDEGSNYSLGERQLIALTRALVRDNKILILDEATSSVDFETDHKIQSTIAKEFEKCTILCIAHRLNTILGYDRILVLDQGEVAEFDTPLNLFTKEDGIFRGMCSKSNITEEQVYEAQKENGKI